MKKVGFIIVLISPFLFLQTVNSQSLFEKLAKKAKEKTEEKVQEEAEEEMDKELEKAFESMGKAMGSDSAGIDSDEGGSWSETMAKMGYSSDPVTYEEQYDFNSSVTMNIKTYDKDGDVKGDGVLKLYAGGNDGNFGYEFVSGEVEGNANQKGIMLMDIQNSAVIILNDEDGKKSGVVFGSNKDFKGDATADDVDASESFEDAGLNPTNIKKTGRTKTILGYKCEEYEYKDEHNEGSAWITDELDWKSEDFMTGIFKSSTQSFGVMNGFLMASETLDLEDGQRTVYEVTDVNKSEKNSFKMADYEVTNLGIFKMPEETKGEE